MSYKLKLEIFEGPLDLLLYLIKKDDMDITDIRITDITDQYMTYIETMKNLDLDFVGDFLVMAATLMQIKSRMLLPPDPEELAEEEEDPRDELVRRLQEYKKFKEIAETLQTHETKRKDLFARIPDVEVLEKWQEDSKEIYIEANLFDLINALSDALKKVPEKTVHEVKEDEYTVEEKIHETLHRLLQQPRILLKDLLTRSKSKNEMIVTFLAVLELIRLREIKIVQKKHFGEIEIVRNKENIIPVSKEDKSD